MQRSLLLLFDAQYSICRGVVSEGSLCERHPLKWLLADYKQAIELFVIITNRDGRSSYRCSVVVHIEDADIRVHKVSAGGNKANKHGRCKNFLYYEQRPEPFLGSTRAC